MIRISAVGLTEQDLTVLSVAKNLLSAVDVDVALIGGDDGSGDIVFLNGEDERAREYLEKSELRTVVVATEVPTYFAGHLVLSKPLRVQAVKDFLLDRVELLVSEESTSEVEREVPSAAETLFQSLVTDAAEGLLSHVSIVDEGIEIYVHGPTRTVYTDGFDTFQALLSQQRDISFARQMLTDGAFVKATNCLSAARLENIIWELARHQGAGRLYIPAAHSDVFQLIAWPRFGITRASTQYLKLAATLTRNHVTIREAADCAGCTPGAVADFLNAAYALGNLEVGTLSDGARPTVQSAAQRPSLLARIAKHLSIADA